MHLERSAVPVGERFDTMIVPEYISDVIVIHGRVMNYHTHEVYQAPALIPRTCSKFSPVSGPGEADANGSEVYSFYDSCNTERWKEK